MSYVHGTDVVGAVPLADQAIVIKVLNLPALIAQRGGAVGKLANQLAPQMIADRVYDEMRKKIAAGFSGEGVEADVRVVAAPLAEGLRPPSDFAPGVAAGAVAVTALVGGYHLIRALLRSSP